MSQWGKLAQTVSKTSKSRNGYTHIGKKKKRDKKARIVLFRKGELVSETSVKI